MWVPNESSQSSTTPRSRTDDDDDNPNPTPNPISNPIFNRNAHQNPKPNTKPLSQPKPDARSKKCLAVVRNYCSSKTTHLQAENKYMTKANMCIRLQTSDHSFISV